MIELIPNWHPIWVHFAIALLVSGTAIYVLFAWNHGPAPSTPKQALVVARWMLWLGSVAALASLLTGFWASTSVVHDDPGHANMLVHRNWAVSAAVIFVIGAGWEFLRRRVNSASVLSAVFFLAGSVALAVTGMEGAENVYEHGLGVQRLPNVSEHDHSHAHTPSEAGSGHQGEPGVSDHPAAGIAAQLSQAISAGNTDELDRLLDRNVVIFESGNVESSLEEYENHHMKSDMAFMAAMNVERLSQKVIDMGDSAVVISRSRISGVYRNKEIDLVNTETLVLERHDGDWKIVHIHWSSS